MKTHNQYLFIAKRYEIKNTITANAQGFIPSISPARHTGKIPNSLNLLIILSSASFNFLFPISQIHSEPSPLYFPIIFSIFFRFICFSL